jgi:hypothetical protein
MLSTISLRIIMQKNKVLLLTMLMLSSAPVFAAMPLQTDDTGTQGKGHSQIEFGMELTSNREINGDISAKSTGGSASGTFTFGLSDRIDLVSTIPCEWYTDKENGVTVADKSGLGDLALQLKWRFLENSDTGFSLAMKPGITIPLGNENKGFGTGKVCGEVTLIVTHEAELLTTNVNFGYSHHEYRLETDKSVLRNDLLSASAGAELNVTDRLRSVGEIGIESCELKDADTNPAYILFGLIYAVNDNFDIDLGIKGALNEAATDSTLLVGITTRF